ncbi:hypothetical protein F5B20DRAFT_524301 [Whalleya microplaca]|nr:hypothetical protein F5B20DRAFT_524301 [Whalleya microplaca]
MGSPDLKPDASQPTRYTHPQTVAVVEGFEPPPSYTSHDFIQGHPRSPRSSTSSTANPGVGFLRGSSAVRDQPYVSQDHPSSVNNESYRRIEPMSIESLRDNPGCCFSTTGGSCCSDNGGCCFSNNGGCCFSDHKGCCFSDYGGCCCSRRRRKVTSCVRS